MAVPSGVIFPWPSTAASIPSGWSRYTALDTYYVQGAPTSGDADLTARGNSNHNHTVDDHTHVQNSHTHSVSAGAGSGSINTDPTGIPRNPAASVTHTHGAKNSASATAVNQNASVTLNASSNNHPPYVKVIWIESNGTPNGVPSNCYAFFESDTLPSGWSRVQGDKYLLGADASGDGGGTGGSATHTHTTTGSHNHTQNAHTHGATTSSSATGTAVGTLAAGAANIARQSHTHSISLQSATATNNSADITLQSANHEPVYRKLNIINNGTGGEDLPDGIIGCWKSTNASIPTDWERVTNFDGQFVKGANANGESDVTTGGATTHTHTADAHTHTQNAHTHTPTVGSASVTIDRVLPYTSAVSTASHTHSWTVANATATNQNTVVNVNSTASEGHYPPYKRVIFIKFNEPSTAFPLRTLMGVGI